MTLVTEPLRTVAVGRFSWYALEWRDRRRNARLHSTFEDEGTETLGEFDLLRYNEPWISPFMPRNELAVEIANGADNRFDTVRSEGPYHVKKVGLSGGSLGYSGCLTV